MILLGDLMVQLSSKWARTQLWIFALIVVIFCSANEYLLPSPLFWIPIGIYCLFNAYLELIVSAIFITPGPAKESLDSVGWQSHMRDFDKITTHIQTFRQQHTAPLIVLLHGWRGSSASVQGRAEWFVNQGWHVVLCELPGHGKSTRVARWNALTAVKHIQYHIKNLDELIEPQDVSHVFLYGHSMGGYICTRLSIDKNNIPYDLPLSGLVLESPLMLYSKILNEIRDRLMIPNFLHSSHMRRVFRDVKIMHPSIHITGIEQFDVPQWGVPAVPTLCLQAMTDTRLGRDHYDATVKMLSQSDNLSHHLIESMTHSGARTNEEREHHLRVWLNTLESIVVI